MSIADAFRKLVGKRAAVPREQVMRAFKRRYVSFKDLLQSNTDLGNILAAMDESLHGNAVFGTSQIRAEATKAVFHTMRMVTCLNAISGNRYPMLPGIVEDINKRISAELDERPAAEISEYTLPLRSITAEHAEYVGGKNANLGELRNVLGLPVPKGFAVTTAAYHAFMRSGGLLEDVRKILRDADPAWPESILEVARTVEARMAAAPLPEAMERALLHAWDETFGEKADVATAALRSSALAEDGSHTFAGQYRTILGVRRETLGAAFRQVAASLFSPRAITYRLCHGYVFENIAMAMCCLEMVDAVAAGVAFSRHPVDLHSDAVLINGLWGLGEQVVDGTATPDSWLMERGDLHVKSRTVAHKTVRLQLETRQDCMRPQPLPVDPALQDAPCLTDAQAAEVARMALTLEHHYHQPQDLEWALDASGRIMVLQARPIRLADGRGSMVSSGVQRPSRIEGAALLLDGGDIAAAGVASGPVVPVDPDSDLEDFPKGGVLLARHSSPNVVVAMERAEAVIAETGSLTGHMASICREFGLPTLLNLPGAFATLRPGQVVTVDALSGRVYEGEVSALLELKCTTGARLRNSPIHALLDNVAAHILPLHLVDPKSALFTPENCTTLHDVMRYVHEQSYSEMFLLSDSASEAGTVASQLRCNIPLDVYVIDLGEGLRNPEASVVYPEDVRSIPFSRLLRGMLRPEVQARGPRPVNMSGFLSVMGQSMIGGNHQGGERFGDRSYAIISDRYLNFSSRVGYHYAVLDAWCGDTMNKNYITFKFAGGAADEVRRARRVRCIGRILSDLGFRVEVVADRVQARFQKYPRPKIEERLDQVGRLLIVTRQMDMLMISEDSVQEFADKFMRGEYH